MPNQSVKQRLMINSAANTGHMVAKVALTFFLTPVLVHGLGDARYGVWMFVNSIIAYFALGDLGIQQAAIRFVAKYGGLNDNVRINRVYATSTAILGCVAAFILLITALVALFWDRPFSLPDELAGEARWLLFLLGCVLAVSMTFGVPKAVLSGLGHYPVLNGVRVINLLLRSALLVAVIWLGGGLVSIGLVVLLVAITEAAGAFVAARRCLPELQISTRCVDRESAAEIFGYGSNMFVGSIAMLVISQSAFVIIANCLTVESVTYFSLGSSLKDQVLTAFVAMIAVLTPAVSSLDAVGSSSAIRQLFLVTTRYALFLLLPVELGLITMGHPFLSLWIGEKYADASYMTLAIVSLPLFLSAPHLVGSRILEGVGRVRPLAIVTVIQAMCTIVMSLVLVRRFGIEGIASAMAIPATASSLAVTALICRHADVKIVTLVRRTLLAPVAASAVAVVSWLTLLQWFPVQAWSTFFIIGFAGMLPYVVLSAAMEPQFRRLLRIAFRWPLIHLTAA